MILKKAKLKFNKNNVRVSAGIFLVLFAIYALLNYGFVSTALVFGSAFFFGNLYFIPFAGLAIIGFKMIFWNKISAIHYRSVMILSGTILALLCALIFVSLFSNIGNVSGYDLRLDNFYSAFTENLKYNGNLPVEVFTPSLGGGVIGILLAACFNSIFNSFIGTIVIVSSLILLALFLLLFRPIKGLIHYFSKTKNVKNEDYIEENSIIKNETDEFVSSDNEIIDDDETKENIIKSEINVIDEEQKIIDVPSYENENNAELETEIFDVPEPEENNTVNEDKKSSNNDFNVFPANAFHFSSGETTIVSKDEIDDELNQQSNMKEEADSKIEDFDDSHFYNDTEKVDLSILDEIDENEIKKSENNDNSGVFDELDSASEDSVTINTDDDTPFDVDAISEENDLNESNKVDNLIEDESAKEIISDSNNDFRETTNSNQNTETKIDKNDNDLNILKEAYRDVVDVDYPEYIIPFDTLFEKVENDPGIRERNKIANDINLEKINTFFEENKIAVKAVEYKQGPAVTVFYLEADITLSTSAISSRITELSRFLYGVEINFVETVPGKPYSALEIRNKETEIVSYVEVYQKMKEKPGFDKNSFVYGVSFDGTVETGNLRKTPHFLVCGTSGSGKSVFEHNLLLSLLINNSPEDVRFVLIDPKKVELSSYNDVPHLLCPPITDLRQARNALKKVTEIMDNRYEIFKQMHCKNFESYNNYCKQNGLKKMPRIVVLIDEYANLKEEVDGVEIFIQKLSSMSRAAGISLILVTQRPSANLLSSSIKSNLSSRVCFKTTDATNSRIILDETGAEKLAGHGDMLVLDSNLGTGLVRLQGPYISDDDADSVTRYLINHYKVKYDDNFMNLEDEEVQTSLFDDLDDNDTVKKEDSLLNDIIDYIFNFKGDYISQAMLVKNYQIGTGRAGKICVQLQRKGILDSQSVPTKGFKILIRSQAELDDYNNEKLLESEDKNI